MRAGAEHLAEEIIVLEGSKDGSSEPVGGTPETPAGASILARTPTPPGGPKDAPATAPKPPHQRPELPDFWDHRFAQGTTPWDAGRVPEQLAQFAGTHPERPRTLIPGCGSAYEAAFLDRLGWPVTALDFSAAAIAAARSQLAGYGGQLLHADFFDFNVGEPFELIYERAFLCALPRQLWPAWAPRCAELLAPGGLLVGFFYFGDDAKGPPFAIRPEALDELLGPWFERLADAPAEDSIAVFAGKERWQVWRRR